MQKRLRSVTVHTTTLELTEVSQIAPLDVQFSTDGLCQELAEQPKQPLSTAVHSQMPSNPPEHS